MNVMSVDLTIDVQSISSDDDCSQIPQCVTLLDLGVKVVYIYISLSQPNVSVGVRLMADQARVL